MMSWYLVYCKPKQEARACENIMQQGIEAFYPTFTRRKTSAAKQIIQPLFPRYLFVYIDPYSVHFSAIKYTRGVSDFVRFGERLQIVPEEIMSQLRIGQPVEEQCDFKSGDQVTLSSGCYKNIDAIYQQADGDTRSVLLIKLLNQYVEIVAQNDDIQKLS
ncbi:transcription/translation regulatory transformer protein RfaH [Pseudoalteromonas sp. JBTF-M23]|uniref:Transcription/translation regulatory transformer protein RfaH n=1 Tax=Pseudoalteromonas caenipelagi TaxID=2726988 RepID=A0A849VET2_9GAMM|nr:transcription/translation regulatory transformer protein RfaH [Pseudoalteromonas caenipelagi]NOU51786.1 transcription/translation regulatory transformer protein RfaH [Pseudoalteromonas caenipelagi]